MRLGMAAFYAFVGPILAVMYVISLIIEIAEWHREWA